MRNLRLGLVRGVRFGVALGLQSDPISSSGSGPAPVVLQSVTVSPSPGVVRFLP